MPSETRGKLSKREWEAKKSGGTLDYRTGKISRPKPTYTQAPSRPTYTRTSSGISNRDYRNLKKEAIQSGDRNRLRNIINTQNALKRGHTQTATNIIDREEQRQYSKPGGQSRVPNINPQVEALRRQFSQANTTRPVQQPKEDDSWLGRARRFAGGPRVGVMDVAREIPGAAKQVGMGVGGFARDVAQSVARGGATTISSFAEPFLGREGATLRPEGRVSQTIFGKEPITPITQRAEEWRKKAEPYGKLAQTGAMFLPVAGVALDIAPWGLGKKTISIIAKSKNVKQISHLLKGKIADNLVDDVARQLIDVDNVDDVARVIKQARKPLQEGKTMTDLQHARGTKAAVELGGFQTVGAKNLKSANKVLENAGEIPKEIKTKSVTKDFIRDYYETKKPPVVGDAFINAKGEKIEITKVGDKSVDYFLKGKKKGIAGTIYTDTGFKSQPLQEGGIKKATQKEPEWVAGADEKLEKFYGKEKTRGFVETIKKSEKTKPEVVSGIGGKYSSITNKATIEKANRSIAKDFEGAVRRAKTQEHLTTDVQAESLRLIDELQAKGRTQDAIDIVEKMSERATSGGQATEILAAYNRLTPEGILMTAQRQVEKARKLNPEKFGNLKLNPEDAGKFRKMAEKVRDMIPGEAKDAATRDMLDELARLVPTPWARKLTTLWKAGLLTGIKGAVGGNIIGNTTMAVLKKVSDVPAAGIDNALALATGNRSKVFTLKGIISGAWVGVKEGISNMRRGIGAGSMAHKLDYQKTYFGKGILGRAAQKYTDTVYNFYSAADRPFFNSALKNNLYDLAKVEAKNKGLKGKTLTEFVEKLVKEPTDEILSRAVEGAETLVFQNRNPLGAALSGAKKGLKQYGGSAGEIISEGSMPFTGVPSSIAMLVHNYNPTGAVEGAIKAISAVKNGNFNQATQRMLVESLGKAMTGTGIIYAGMKLTDSGQMTLGYPKDAGERSLWEAEGKIPYAIKLFGKWRSLNYTGPIMSLLAIGGEIQTAKKSGESGLTAIGTGALGSGKAIISSSPLSGMQAGLDAITDPQRYGESYFRNQASSVIPTLVKDVAIAGDKIQREVNTVSDAMKSKIPGLRGTLLPKRDIFGKEVSRQTSTAGSIVDPFRSSEAKTSPLTEEFRRLQDSGYGPTLARLTKNQKINGENIVLSPEKLDEFEKFVGNKSEKLVNELIKKDSYNGLSDEERQKEINDIFNLVKKEARINILGSNEKFPESTLEATQKYEEYKNLSDKEFMLKREELTKIGDKETEIAKQLGALRRNETTKKIGLEFEGDWSRNDFPVQDKANVIMKKMDGLSDGDKTKFFQELIEKDVATDDLKKEIAKQMYDKFSGTLEDKAENLKKYGGEMSKSLVKAMFPDIYALEIKGKYEEVDAITKIIKLSDDNWDNWDTYKESIKSWKTGNTNQFREYMGLEPSKAVEYLQSLGKTEENRIINDVMTNDEWDSYQRAESDYDGKKELSKVDEYKKMGFSPEIIAEQEKLAGFTATNASFEPAGSMRTDRHNNPTAFTTDVAKTAGWREGVDYEVGDPFPNNPNLRTAKIIGNPVDKTIQMIDKIGFYTDSGKQRWSYIGMSNDQWKSLSKAEKTGVIASMYSKEGGSGNLMDTKYAQMPLRPAEKTIVQQVGSGQLSEKSAANKIVSLYQSKPPVQPTVEPIPTSPEYSRTSAWLATLKYKQNAFNIYSLILAMRNFSPMMQEEGPTYRLI